MKADWGWRMLFVLALTLACTASDASWDASRAEAKKKGSFCLPVKGKFTSRPAPPETCQSPVGLCTEGELTGGLLGGSTYAFTMTGLIPAEVEEDLFFFVGASEITTRVGSLILGSDAGTIDLNPTRSGNFVSLITFGGGTGVFTNASGQIALRGRLDLATGTVAGDYLGELCSAF